MVLQNNGDGVTACLSGVDKGKLDACGVRVSVIVLESNGRYFREQQLWC
jgi:hypothetical protein